MNFLRGIASGVIIRRRTLTVKDIKRMQASRVPMVGNVYNFAHWKSLLRPECNPPSGI